jgi:DNA-directed RNA polymerase specialized sigma24 family protein
MSIASLNDAQREFTAHLPAIENATRYAFRRRLRRQEYEDVLAEAIAACWSAWVGLISRGRDPLEVGVCGIASQAVRYVRNGRRLARGRNGGGRHKMDIYHGRAQVLGGYKVISYDTGPAERSDYGPAAWKEVLIADRRTTPADVACARLDFQSWLSSLPERRRRTAELLAQGYGTGEVAREVGVTAPAIAQARAALARSWSEFQGERGPGGDRRPVDRVRVDPVAPTSEIE